MPDDERPPLRDRNRFFHHLLNGSRDEFERVAPLWREQRRRARLVEQRRPVESPEPAHRVTDSRLRSMRLQVDREKKARSSCARLLRSVRAARRRIGRASTRRARDEATRAAVSQDAKEIAKRLAAVRKHVLRLNRQLGPDSPFGQDDVLWPDVAGGDADHKARKRTYRDLETVLDAFERQAVIVRRDINSRRRLVKREERARRTAGQSRALA